MPDGVQLRSAYKHVTSLAYDGYALIITSYLTYLKHTRPP
jgi:hypothetical protein